MSAVLDKYGITYDKSGLLWTISASEAGVDELLSNHAEDQPVSKSMTLFLEKGNSKAGLEHIWERHGEDFKKLANEDFKKFLASESLKKLADVDPKEALQKCISMYIYKIMAMGHYATWGYTAKTVSGFEVVYIITEQLYLHVVFGSNGFIVTAMIKNNKMADYDKYPY